jgi:hypothetical protein
VSIEYLSPFASQGLTASPLPGSSMSTSTLVLATCGSPSSTSLGQEDTSGPPTRPRTRTLDRLLRFSTAAGLSPGRSPRRPSLSEDLRSTHLSTLVLSPPSRPTSTATPSLESSDSPSARLRRRASRHPSRTSSRRELSRRTSSPCTRLEVSRLDRNSRSVQSTPSSSLVPSPSEYTFVDVQARVLLTLFQ